MIAIFSIDPVSVGNETVEESSDLLLKRDMPPALEMVQAASDSLGQAAQFIAADPYSVQERVAINSPASSNPIEINLKNNIFEPFLCKTDRVYVGPWDPSVKNVCYRVAEKRLKSIED